MRYVNAGGMKVEVICSIKGVKEDMDGTQMLIQAKNANVANYIIEHCISMGHGWTFYLSGAEEESICYRAGYC